MSRVILYGILFLTSLSFFSSCETEELENLGWKPEFLGPLAKTSLDFYDFEDLLFASTTYEIFAAELGYDYDEEVDVPPIDSTDFDPEYLSISSFFKRLSVDSALINIKITNTFPIPIGKGTRIVANDSASGELLFDHAITRELAAGEDYTFPFYARNTTLSSALEFSVKDFTSPGAQDVIFRQQPLEVVIDIEFVVIQEVVVKNDIEYQIAKDTIDFSFGFDDAKDTAAYSGYLSLLIDSYFPTTMIMSLELLDENDQVVYDFFDQEPADHLVLPAGVVSPAGMVVAKTEKNLINYIDVDRDLAQMNKGVKMVVSGIVKTDPSPEEFIFTEESEIIITITGRLKIDPTRVQ